MIIIIITQWSDANDIDKIMTDIADKTPVRSNNDHWLLAMTEKIWFVSQLAK